MLLNGDTVEVVVPLQSIKCIEDAHYLATYKGKQGTIVSIQHGTLEDVYAVKFMGNDRLGYFYSAELKKVGGK